MPEPQGQPNQQTQTPQVSDKTIDAFMAVDDGKKRDALSKMSEPTKQALLQGIKARKAPTVEKAMPFSSGVATGMMLDPTKIAQQKTTGGQALEVGKQMATGAKDLGISILKDPLNVGNPIDAIVKGQQSAYRKVHQGLKTGDHDMLMNGLGEAVGNLSMLLGGAKVDEGIGVGSTAREAAFATKDLTAKRAIVSAASNAALDTLKDTHSAAIDTAVKAERARIGGNVEAINVKDIAKDPQGYVPQRLAVATLDQAIQDKKAQVLMDKKMLPGVAKVRGLLEGHAQNLTFNDLKQVRTIVDSYIAKATGVEKAVLGDYRESLTKNMSGRSKFLNAVPEWEDYNEASKKLAGHEEGIIPELKSAKTGLDYAKKIAQESNKGRLDTFLKDVHLPSDFFSKDVASHKAIINFAKMSEGDTLVAKTANRLIALKEHPISASIGGAAGVTLGRAVGNAVGSPMAGSFIGLTLGATFAHDLMSKYDAARAIREIGGPSGVMGSVRPSQAPPSSAPPSSMSPASKPSPQNPGGGGTPVGGLPPGTSPSTPPGSSSGPSTSSPLLTAAKAVGGKEAKGAEAAKVVSENKPFQQAQFDSAIDKVKEVIRDKDATPEEKKIAASQLKSYREQAAKLADEPKAPKVTKASPEERGRTESARKGMTKDTPEARKAKAAERIAAKRKSGEYATETSGGNVVSKVEAMKKPGEKITTGGVEDVAMLESRLAELYPRLGGKKFVAKFRSVLKSTYGEEAITNGDLYKGYLTDIIEKKMTEDAKSKIIESQIPGLKKD